MFLEILKYHIFKNVLNNVNIDFNSNVEITDDLLFNLANFNTVSNYYTILKNNKYDINSKFNNGFNDFFIDCLINTNKEYDYNKLIFIYALYSSNEIDNYINQYIDNLNINIDKNIIYNMIDKYISTKIDINLNNKLINIFKDGFNYYDYIDDVIHNPLIKHYYIMSSYNLYKLFYKYKYKFYKHYTSNNLYILIHKIRHLNNKSKYFKYKYEITDDILNISNNEYNINDKKCNYNLDKLIEYIINKLVTNIEIFNKYFIENDDKELRKLFKINKDKKI